MIYFKDPIRRFKGIFRVNFAPIESPKNVKKGFLEIDTGSNLLFTEVNKNLYFSATVY
jgi:hypothetical protein